MERTLTDASGGVDFFLRNAECFGVFDPLYHTASTPHTTMSDDDVSPMNGLYFPFDRARALSFRG
jgi:hypothetical protein